MHETLCLAGELWRQEGGCEGLLQPSHSAAMENIKAKPTYSKTPAFFASPLLSLIESVGQYKEVTRGQQMALPDAFPPEIQKVHKFHRLAAQFEARIHDDRTRQSCLLGTSTPTIAGRIR